MRWDFPYPARRVPVLADNLVASSQPLATQAGLRMLQDGGSAADAIVACAAALTVVEPVMNGLGSDAFALLWQDGKLKALNGSGRAPAAWTRARFAGRSAMPSEGWDTVTVPGAVSAWVALWREAGRLPFAQILAPAIHYAENGFLVSPTIARQWRTQAPLLASQPGFAEAFHRGGRTPEPGERFRFPEQAETLRRIAQTEGAAFYHGDLAERMAQFAARTGGALTVEDLANHRADWVAPIGASYRRFTLHELPPNGQGVAALMALGILDVFEMGSLPPESPDSVHLQVEAMKLAFADTYAQVADPAAMRVSAADLLDPEYLRMRAARIDAKRASEPPPGIPPASGTVYLAAADGGGMMVSFIQSNYNGFGSGVVVPGTGISLQNRGAAFNLTPGHPNEVSPGKRPFHTIIPAFLSCGGEAVMSFGVMGADMQPQGHVQLVIRVADHDQNPQAAADAPRWKAAKDGTLLVEAHMPGATVEELVRRGHRVRVAAADSLEFGAAQLIRRLPSSGYAAASESRRDGQAAGF